MTTLRFEKTCESFPEQYDVFLEKTLVGYVRLRNGNLTVEAPDCGGEVIYYARPVGAGEFATLEERSHFLGEADQAITRWLAAPRRMTLEEMIERDLGGTGK